MKANVRPMGNIIKDLNDWRVTSWVMEQLSVGKMVRFYRDTERFHVSTGRSGWGQYRIVALSEILKEESSDS